MTESVSSISNKIALFAVQYGGMKMIGKRRYHTHRKTVMTTA